MATPERPRRERATTPTDPIEALEDLESQAAAWSRDERAVEVSDRAIEAYRSVTLAARLVASLGRQIVVDLGSAGRVRGRLAGAGDGWAAVTEDGRGVDALVLTAAASGVRGLADGAASAAAWPLASRRSASAVLLRQVADRAPVILTLRDGEQRRGRAGRLGADFLEITGDDGVTTLVVLASVAVVRRA